MNFRAGIRLTFPFKGDHGMPGMPGGKCNLYDFGTRVALAACMPGNKGGRVVDDFVSLTDLAPTFMEIGGVTPPAGVTGRSLLPIFRSEKSGQVDATRTWVLTGRERHGDTAREGKLPYPQRALRTAEFLYIRNFAPDRWPMGSPGGVTETSAPLVKDLAEKTFAAFADMDASPTKAWLIQHRNDAQWKWYYDYAFAKRPGEELYDLRRDPGQLKNVANEPNYAAAKTDMAARLMKLLSDYGDPRVTGDGSTFEKPPYAG